VSILYLVLQYLIGKHLNPCTHILMLNYMNQYLNIGDVIVWLIRVTLKHQCLAMTVYLFRYHLIGDFVELYEIHVYVLLTGLSVSVI